MSSLLAVLSAAAFGAADFLGGFASKKSPAIAVSLVSNISGGLVALVLLAVIGGQWSVDSVLLGGFGGLAGLVGLVLLYKALASGLFQVASPVSAVTGAAVPVAAGLALGDRPGLAGAVGLLVTPVAVWLLAGGEEAESRAEQAVSTKAIVGQSLIAGAGFGVFFIMLDLTPADAGAVPLVAARAFSTTALLAISLINNTGLPSREAMPWATAAGLLDMSANGLFLWALRLGDLAIVGALTSLYPAGTVLLAGIFLGERLSRPQQTGLGLALLSAMLLSV